MVVVFSMVVLVLVVLVAPSQTVPLGSGGGPPMLLVAPSQVVRLGSGGGCW